MKRNWWIAVVAVFGIGLAILLFPRPDTGGDPMAGRVQPGANASQSTTTEARVPRGEPSSRPNVADTRPEAVEMQARRATPESNYSNMLVGPVAGLKYSIKKAPVQTDEVPAIEEKIDSVVTELRAVRNDPAARPWSEIEATVESLLTMVTSSSYGSNPDVMRSVERARTLMSQYHTDPHGTGGTTPTGAPMPSTTSTPSGAPPPQEYE